MFKKLFVAAALVALPSFIAAADFYSSHSGLLYLSAHGGYGKVNTTIPGQPKASGGFAADLALGYNFTPVWGTEVGYDYYPSQTFSETVKSQENHAYHLAIRGTVSAYNHVNIYGRLGGAMVHHQEIGTATPFEKSKLTPFMGFGVGYEIIDDLSFDLDMHGTFKRAEIPAMYAVGLGFTWTPSNLF